jgi:hypothetical protein
VIYTKQYEFALINERLLLPRCPVCAENNKEERKEERGPSIISLLLSSVSGAFGNSAAGEN